MNASLYIIGTELTRGIISDMHTRVLAGELSKMGYTIKRSVIVPDDGSIEKSLNLGVKDSDVLLVTGGLGPTSDDMTRNIVADLAGVKLVKNQDAWDTLYKRIGDRIFGANEQQTLIPQGFEVIKNDNGTAPGFFGSFEKEGHDVLVICMPGPPAEMQPMFYGFVRSRLAERIGYVEVECDEYSVFLIAEAKLEELCKEVETEGVTWGTRFQQMRISLYVYGNDRNARLLFIEKLRALVGFGLIADGNVEAVDLITGYLKENKQTISCAESCTCGLVAKTLTDIAGSSAWFWGGVCSYNIEAKKKILGVSDDVVDLVTERCAKEMAEGMLKISGSDVAVSVTGYAGPKSENDTKEVGTVFFGFSSKQRSTEVVQLKIFSTGRDATRRRFTTAALVLAYLYVRNFNLIDITSKWLYI